jgi:transcriptional regulator with XRE-family HTH domain
VQTLPTDEADRRLLGRVLRRHREAARLTQEEVGARARVTKRYLSDLENGARNPTYLVLRRLLRAMGVAWSDFGRELDGSP